MPVTPSPRLTWRPSGRLLERMVLSGEYVRLEPLDPERHAGYLHAASHDPGPDGASADGSLWTYMPYGPFPDAAAMRNWLENVAASSDPLFFAVIDSATGHATGMASYLRYDPPNGVIEIGHIWFAPVLRRSRAASEAIFLLQRHAFEKLGVRRLEWKCNAANEASCRAALRFGFTYEGIFRQHMIGKGCNRDTAWYALLDHEWPAVKEAFVRWLDPANFDAGGRQKVALSARADARRSEPIHPTE